MNESSAQPDEPTAPTDGDAPREEPTRSSRDHEDTRGRIEAWLATRIDGAEDVTVGRLEVPGGSGMSSETLLFDASWHEGGTARDARLVARVAPSAEDVPVFPVYDLGKQVAVLELVAAHTAVPVPAVRWLELDESVIGSPFFVMDRVDGRVPPDIPPYLMEGWLFDASPEDRRHLQDASVGLLADLHAVTTDTHDLDFLQVDAPGDTALRRHVEDQRSYYEWIREDRRHPIIDDAFDWLDANWPDETGPDVLSWGDSRIGNIMYDGFRPVAVFDWEMAAVGPAEIDIGWMIFLHRFFQDLVAGYGMPGLPEFMRADDVAATYEERSGRRVRDLHWFETYAALRHAIVMARIMARSVHFGEGEWPADVDEAIPHRQTLRELIETPVSS